MDKILYIDTESFPSHGNFNSIHIKALMQQGFEVCCVFRENYSDCIKLPNIKVELEIPDRLYIHYKSAIASRFQMLKRLHFIKARLQFEQYRHILLSYYDELVFPFALYPNGVYLINHINLGALNHPIKRILIKYLSKRNTQILLSESAFAFAKNMGFKKCRLVYHGLPEPYSLNSQKPVWMNKHYCLFSPSVTSTDFSVINELISSDSFLSFLEEKDILFVIRGKNIHSNHPNVKIIDWFLTDEDYKGCFIHSDFIFVSYREDRFKYRVSAILLETISNSKKVVVKRSFGVEEYEPYLGKDAFFEDVNGAINSLNRLLDEGLLKHYNYDKKPDYSFLLSK